eukprot:10778834-Alexandrium_andersonii.AAC.1
MKSGQPHPSLRKSMGLDPTRRTRTRETLFFFPAASRGGIGLAPWRSHRAVRNEARNQHANRATKAASQAAKGGTHQAVRQLESLLQHAWPRDREAKRDA